MTLICSRLNRLSFLPVAALTLLASAAQAQSDVDRPLPNVLLLVDTSGSMESRAADNQLPVCNAGNSSATNEKSRWIDLVEVLTGSIDDYSCVAFDRSSPAFLAEYSMDGQPPYDWNYVNPYHRIVSGGCIIGPGELPSANDPYAFPSHGVVTLPFSPPSTVSRPNSFAGFTPCTGFQQAPDGVLDVFREKVRFGLMTFDTHVNPGTGLNGSNSRDTASGMAGTWSYFLNASPVVGRPAQCPTDQPQEVGARNAAAPPWEGRMIAFGAPQAPSSELHLRNQRIQDVLLATRPYGATPIAGLLQDAKDFLWHDTNPDPLDQSAVPADFGPARDPLTLLPECRRNLVILLSDGEPNLDLRPFCENTEAGGRCPYQTPQQIAWDLRNNPSNDPDQRVETVVVGFALSEVTPAGKGTITCAELTDDDCVNNPADRSIQACCTLNAIAAAGGTPNADGSAKTAFFPRNSRELRKTFSSILSNVTTSVTTRTSAVFATATQSASGGGNHQFSSGFEPVLEQPWRGKLTRTRIQCNQDGVPEEQEVDPSAGDSFSDNVNSGSGPAREFITFIAEGNGSNSVRPYLTGDVDGLGIQAGTIAGPLGVDQFLTEVPPTAMALTSASCDQSSAAGCRDDILGWLLGRTNSEGETRCPSAGSGDCSLFGAIFHATPTFVSGAPREYLQDETYASFARERGLTERSSILYAPTIDGLLHAMKTAPFSGDTGLIDSLANNELWAFLPPAVLPMVQAQYPNTPAVLLDGTPIVRDVPAYTNGGSTRFERRQADARVASGSFRTVLTAGFGVGQVGGGYYALDVTDPDLDDGGPKFLWQLTRDAAGTELFGQGGTPTLATVFIKQGPSDPGSDVAIAILPGGDAGLRTHAATAAGPLLAPVDSTFTSAATVGAYSGAEAARSLTIVRLDTGEVLRSFRASAAGALSLTRTSLVDIPAPMTGRAAVFPAATGTNADRAYVGDREGRLWRLDLASSDPSQWSLNVLFDAYFDQGLEARQPVELAPIVSVDEEGRVSLAFATGGQRVQTATPGMFNRVISLTEVFDAGTEAFAADVNWIEGLGCVGTCGANQHEGERVTGPLELFSGTLYFASSVPATGADNQCAQASHRIWAVNYLQSNDEWAGAESPDPLNGPAGMWPNGAQPRRKATDLAPGLVFGVAIEQQPSCSSELSNPTDDPYLGFGTYTSTSTVSPGGFSLVYQVGGVSGNTSGTVATTKLPLDPPPSTVSIDSWAPIFE